MAEKSNLEKILNLKNDEEFEIKGYNPTYRIHNGRRQFKFGKEWRWCDSEESLLAIIIDPSLIQRKPRFSDEEMTFLRLLHKYGNATKIIYGVQGTYVFASNSKSISTNITTNLLKPGETIDLDELFKEDKND